MELIPDVTQQQKSPSCDVSFHSWNKSKPEQNGRSWICFFTLLFSAVYSKFLATATELLDYDLQHDVQEKLNIVYSMTCRKNCFIDIYFTKIVTHSKRVRLNVVLK